MNIIITSVNARFRRHNLTASIDFKRGITCSKNNAQGKNLKPDVAQEWKKGRGKPKFKHFVGSQIHTDNVYSYIFIHHSILRFTMHNKLPSEVSNGYPYGS